jgi:hypothetical protein
MSTPPTDVSEIIDGPETYCMYCNDILPLYHGNKILTGTHNRISGTHNSVTGSHNYVMGFNNIIEGNNNVCIGNYQHIIGNGIKHCHGMTTNIPSAGINAEGIFIKNMMPRTGEYMPQ